MREAEGERGRFCERGREINGLSHKIAREAVRSTASLAKSASLAPIIQSITNNQSHDLVGEVEVRERP